MDSLPQNSLTLLDYLKNIILVGSIVISIILYLKNKKFNEEKKIDDNLLKLQEWSFNNPFLEDVHFIQGWNDFRKQYYSNYTYLDDTKIEKYLKYEQYCEAIFNLISNSYKYHKDEKKMLEQIAFNDWAKVHKDWWNNPLEENSNKDTYERKLYFMIDSWMK